MPTLIRLLIFLLVLAAIAFGGMVALTAMVDPGQKEIRVRIPARDLMVDDSGDPLNIRESLPAPRVTTPDETTPAPATTPQVDDQPE